MPSMEKTLDRLATVPNVVFAHKASRREIDEMQTSLGVVLPDQFIQFLERFGYAAWFGREILGVRPIDPRTGQPSTVIPDCISKTKKERGNPYGTADLPPEHLVVSTDGGGGNFVLFTIGSQYEGQVHWLNLEDSPEPLKVWNSFQDYLDSQIDDALSE